MQSDRILNIRDYPKGLPPGSIRVARPSPWGNPYNITATRDRATVIAQFRRYAVSRLRAEPDWLTPLRGRPLACYCAPLDCHASVLIELGA